MGSLGGRCSSLKAQNNIKQWTLVSPVHALFWIYSPGALLGKWLRDKQVKGLGKRQAGGSSGSVETTSGLFKKEFCCSECLFSPRPPPQTYLYWQILKSSVREGIIYPEGKISLRSRIVLNWLVIKGRTSEIKVRPSEENF